MKKLLTIDQVAERLGVSRSTTRRMWQDGTLPRPIRIGSRSVRWRVEDLESWVDKQNQLDTYDSE